MPQMIVNDVRHNQPIKQENRRQQQQQPRSRQQHHARRNSGRSGPQPLARETGWIFFRQASISQFNLPRNFSIRLCKRFTEVGHECSNGANCGNSSHATFISLSLEEQGILTDWTRDRNVLCWSRGNN